MKNPPSQTPGKRGFALIVTLSLMILLTIIAVGLLSLSSITLRSTSLGSSQAIANSNARLALMLAIGDLQKALGPDQRVSANAGAFDASSPQPNLVGAWTSLGWQGPAGEPPATGDKAKKFRAWLVSTKTVASATDFTLPSKADSADSVWLCNPATTGTIAPNNTRMRAERVPLTVGNNNGGIAWMVSDNSTKAPLNIKTNNAITLAENVANRTAATSPRLDVLNSTFEKISEPNRVITMQSAVLAVPADSKASIKKELSGRYQALTASSLGLLTNPVTGGLKTDLTPLMEGTTNLTGALGASIPYFSQNDGAPSWNFLRTHYQLYKRVQNQAGGLPRFSLTDADMNPVAADNPTSLVRPGIQPTPPKEVLLPVIAKLQIIFSLVSHYSHIAERIVAFDTKSDPLSNQLHAVPHLVCDPIITLYNPYDVELDLTKLRIRVSDPPVGFQFQKHDMTTGANPWYRQEYATGEFHGLARFQRLNEKNVNARKFYTLYLRNKTATGTPGGNMMLLPGEVKVFSPWVETTWTWGLETSGGYTPRAFFDYDSTRTLGTQDLRTNNLRGVETIPGLDFRAGFQTDHLSYENGRANESKYSWEVDKTGKNITPFGVGWLSLKLKDEVTVNAKPQRCVVDPKLPDFRVDILAGSTDNADNDILRTYEFRLGDVPVEMSPTGKVANTITRRRLNENILQMPDDKTPGGKDPFAIFTMSAKTTKGTRDDSKAWLFNNMVTAGGSHDSKLIGNAAQSYDLRLEEIQDFTTFPGVEYDSNKQRGYFGAIANASGGVSIVPMYRVPLTPAASLGDWIAGNLITSSQFPRVNYALGNSFAHPLVPSDKIYTTSPMGGSTKVLDHSYLMNATLWDGFYFSSATRYSGESFSTARNKNDVLAGFFNGTKPMLNSRLSPYIADGGDPQSVANDYAGKNDTDFSKTFAKNAMIQGAFNVNSDSIDAWRAVLSSLRDASVKGYGNLTHAVDKKTAFVRNGMPVAGSADDANPQNSVNALGQIRWAGFRTLTDTQIQNLATLIVEEIRAAAKEDSSPSLCLGDFINRRLGSASALHTLKGILQTAIDKSDINTSFHTKDSNNVSVASLADNRTKNLSNTAALNGFTADGAAPMLTQGDLLTGLAPIITARGDTFTIRCYGEARANNGTTVLAKSWCEATVQRVPEYVDGSNGPDAVAAGLTPVNQAFGRRFIVSSFRWLSASEI